MKTKQCNNCYGLFPITYFGVYIRYSDGYNVTCKACRSEWNKYNSARKRGINLTISDVEYTRSFNKQNEQCIDTALSGPKLSCIGYRPHDDQLFIVVFELDSNFCTIAIHDSQGELFNKSVISYPDLNYLKTYISNHLKHLKLRLELSELDYINTRKTVYLK